ncbi:hypothetical protein HOY80DRAFT_1040198 [Tuber brumale]|nr:hypothetical protein HOY80DRAFT_1040198 [Tuber brumale]
MAASRKSNTRYEEHLEQAIRVIKSGDEPNVAVRREAFEVNLGTLYRRLAGMTLARAAAHEEQQRLTGLEQKAIVKSCITQDDIGFSLRLDMVEDMAIHLDFKQTVDSTPHTWQELDNQISPVAP